MFRSISLFIYRYHKLYHNWVSFWLVLPFLKAFHFHVACGILVFRKADHPFRRSGSISPIEERRWALRWVLKLPFSWINGIVPT